MLLPIGATFLDKYEILELLSSTPLNYVYKAVQKPLDRTVILKILTPNVSSNAEAVSRFEREAKLLSLVKEDGVTKIYDYGKHNGIYYIITEYVDGMSIRELLNQKGRLPLHLAAYIILETSKILHRLHQQGIIHRDIKPENIIISVDQRLKLTDLGLAFSQTMPTITVDGAILGTPAYMSPEQIVGKPVDKKSDIYSLGVVFYELLTGFNPFISESYSATMHKVLNFKPTPIHQIDKSLETTKDVWLIIEPMLHKESSKRYQDLSEVITKLELLLNRHKPNLSLITNLPKQSILLPVNKPKLKTTLVYIVLIFIFTIIALSIWYKLSKTNKVLPTAQIEKHQLTPKHELNSTISIKSDINQPLKETTITKISDKKSEFQTQKITNNESGSVKISVLPWATVSIDGKEIFTTPKDTIINLMAGTHIIKLSNPNFPIIESIINLKPNQHQVLIFDLNEYVGYLQITVQPWADIYINDDYKTTTPISSPLILPIGKHKLTLKNPYFSPYIETISIKSKQTIERNIILK